MTASTTPIKKPAVVQVVELLTEEGDRVQPNRAERKFQIYASGTLVGQVAFVNAAKRYAFLPDDTTYFGEMGLREIADFLDKMNATFEALAVGHADHRTAMIH